MEPHRGSQGGKGLAMSALLPWEEGWEGVVEEALKRKKNRVKRTMDITRTRYIYPFDNEREIGWLKTR